MANIKERFRFRSVWAGLKAVKTLETNSKFKTTSVWEMKLHSFFIGHSNIAEYVSSISVSQTANDIEWLYE